jgi:hypothetical protein
MPEKNLDKAVAFGMCRHGNFPDSCAACGAEKGDKAEAPEISRERLKEINSLNIEVKSDLAPLLEAVNKDLGTKMQHRESGFHVTILGPTEMKILETLSDEQLEKLNQLSADIAAGRGLEVRGIGAIDGATANLPKKDREKRTSFLAVDVPALNEFRADLGLAPKDFHVTLGFEGGDIHMELTGEKDEKGKEKTRPIPKRADPKYDGLLGELPAISFGGLSGEVKEKKQEKAVDPKKEAKERMKKALGGAGLGGKDLIGLGFTPGPEMGKVSAAIERAVSEGGEVSLEASDKVRAELAKRIEQARENLKAG